MPNVRIVTRKGGCWVFVDERHKKTIPPKYTSVFDECVDQIDFAKKRLNDDEKTVLSAKFIESTLKEFLEQLQKKEKHLFDLIKGAKPIAVRKVFSKNGNRKELIFDNNLKIKCPNVIFNNFHPQEKEVYLNY